MQAETKRVACFQIRNFSMSIYETTIWLQNYYVIPH